MGSDRLRSSRVSSVPPSETQVTNTGSFVVVCCGIANESAEALTTPFTGSRCLGFEFEITERQPFGIRIPWFQAYLDGGVATRPFTLNGPAGTLDVVPSAKRFALDTESTVITPSVAVKRRPSASNGSSTCETNSNPLRDGYGLSRDSGRGATSNVGSLPARSILSRDTRNGSRTDPPGGDLVITDRSPRRFAFARLWRAVFPDGGRAGFRRCRSRRHRPMTDCGTNLTIHPLQ